MNDRIRKDLWRIAPGSASAYGLALSLVCLATATRLGLGFFTGYLQAFTTFYPAVLFAALWGGAGPGIVAAIVGGLVCWWWFLPPYTFLAPLNRADAINVATYFAASAMIVWATDHYRQLTRRLRDEEKLRNLAVDELAHRLRNKVATIQSIINFRLREFPEIKKEIDNCLVALRRTDELIATAQGRGAHVRDIVAAELAPYDHSRRSIEEAQCLLHPRLALTMALLLHALATNAAKYGALSNATGKLAIEWSLSDRRLNLAWIERGGPPIESPSHSGFGTRLFQRALDQFDGTVELIFAPHGLVCNLDVALA